MKKILFSLLMVAGLVSLAKAEATKELFNDFGLYSGNPAGSQPMNILQWSFSAITVNPNYTVDPSTPEGRDVVQTVVTHQYGGWGIFNVTANGSTTAIDRDYSDYKNGHLRFFLKSTTELTVRVEYVSIDTTNRQIPIRVPSTGNVWKEIVIPLASLPSDFNIHRVRSPFIIAQEATPGGATTWFVDDVRWTKPLRTVNPLTIYPISPKVKANGKREITIEGRDSNNETVVVYSTYGFLYSGDGKFAPVSPVSSQAGILTAGNLSGGILGTVLANPGDGTAANPDDIQQVFTDYTVDPSWKDTQYGLLSESIPGIILDSKSAQHNGDLILFSENSNNLATLPAVSDDSTDPREGTKDIKTVFLNKTQTQFQGWAIQWGQQADTTQNADSYTIDMSQFYEGSVRFWFKAPATTELINGLTVGIRSGNVPAGQEESKVKLSTYVTFDGNWHPVVLPMTLFAKGRPFADIARTKVFFNIALAGAINVGAASRTFYIDNLRWDTQNPGPLARIDVQPNQNPGSILVPFGFKRLFTATGYDANNAVVDISPAWDFGGGPSLGTLAPPTGPSTILQASNGPVPVSGQVRASVGTISGSSLVDVKAVTFTGSYNVYSDLGVGGEIGIATGPKTALGTELKLDEMPTGGPEGVRFMEATYSVVSTPGQNDAFATWFVEEPNFPRYMAGYEHGYLHFFVRTTENLEISIRSANVPADTNKAKVLLSEFGVPIDGTWQEVIIPLDYFKSALKQSDLDFSQIVTYFAIGATAATVGGDVTAKTFDVDDVRWLTTDQRSPSVNKVYQGLIEKQRPSGLVRSYGQDLTSAPSNILPDAYTYDQALAAMAFTYHRSDTLAQNIFNVYKTKFSAGAFDGFNDDYDVDTLSPRVSDRTTGPNAWMLLALIHYRNVTNSTANDAMMTGIANWLIKFQDSDGAIKFGKPANTNNLNVKSTEQNLDCYAAFKAYAMTTGNITFSIAANRIYAWLTTGAAWNVSQQRFNVGTNSDGVTPNTDKALDVFSWAPLALSSYTSVLSTVENDFGVTKVNNDTGLPVTGFDFSGPFGQPVDKDAVWLEGTAQMVLAYLAAGNTTKASFYQNELLKAVENPSSTSQGLAYATNKGTAYGFTMTFNYPAVSSDAWFIFSDPTIQFNPFQVYPIFAAEPRNVSDNQKPSLPIVSWTGIDHPGNAGWVRADQYIKMAVQPISIDPWGLQIYTDNTSVTADPKFVDPTPCVNNDIKTCNNPDSDPSGLLFEGYYDPRGAFHPVTTTSDRLPVAWSVKDTTDTASTAPPSPADPNDATDPHSFQWLFLLDKNTPAIDRNGDGKIVIPPPNTTYSDLNDTSGFSDQIPFVTVKSPAGIHGDQGDTQFFTPALPPDYIYLETVFTSAAAQSVYRTTTITLEFFFQ